MRSPSPVLEQNVRSQTIVEVRAATTARHVLTILYPRGQTDRCGASVQNFTSRKFRPTASAQYGARHSNHYAALCERPVLLAVVALVSARSMLRRSVLTLRTMRWNRTDNAQMYLPAIGTMPAAYQNPCSHAPVQMPTCLR
eukprot:COSAG03_NODE_98_length_13005_cov_17.216953_7_plen_141_part_00